VTTAEAMISTYLAKQTVGQDIRRCERRVSLCPVRRDEKMTSSDAAISRRSHVLALSKQMAVPGKQLEVDQSAVSSSYRATFSRVTNSKGIKVFFW
jgi:hypothetical protein